MKRLPLHALLLIPLLLLGACAPAITSVVSPPTFRVVESQTALLSLEPQGVGLGNALIHLELEARNPNPFPIHLAGLDGDLYLGGQRVAGSTFREGVSLPAGGTSQLGLDISVPVAGTPQVLGQFTSLVVGEAVEFRLDATVTVDLLGTPQRFPTLTIAQGNLQAPGGLRPPEIRYDASATRVSLSGLTAQIDVGLLIDNPLPLGYFVRGPQVTLQLDGRTVSRVSVPRTAVPARGTSTAALRFEVGIADAGAALLSRLQTGGRGVQFSLSGALEVEIPGVASTSTALSNVGGLLP
ncbi:MAG: LEA type 2 family protein [Trueperaceae bacterium]